MPYLFIDAESDVAAASYLTNCTEKTGIPVLSHHGSGTINSLATGRSSEKIRYVTNCDKITELFATPSVLRIFMTRCTIFYQFGSFTSMLRVLIAPIRS